MLASRPLIAFLSLAALLTPLAACGGDTDGGDAGTTGGAAETGGMATTGGDAGTTGGAAETGGMATTGGTGGTAATGGAPGGMDGETGSMTAESCAAGTWDHDGDPGTECKAFTVCAAGARVGNKGSATLDRDCEPCAAGEYSITENAAACTSFKMCAAGTYVSDAGSATRDRTCTTCETGTFSAGENASSCAAHGVCPPGEYETVAPSATTDRTCAACAEGSFSDVTNATACATPSSCGAGSYETAAPSSTADRTCAACAPGTFSAGDNATACVAWAPACAAGYEETVSPSAIRDRLCADTDECAGADPCTADGDSAALCANTTGSYTCTCSATALEHAGRCLPTTANCSALQALDATIPSGVYTVDVDGAGDLAAMQVYCDMEQEGGGWMLVANFVHQGGTNPETPFSTDSLPLLGPGVLGDDESGTGYFGYAGNALMTAIGADELRFYGESGSHSRVLHFSTTDTDCIRFLESGVTASGAVPACEGVATTFTPLAGHTAFLPAATTDSWNGTIDNALRYYPFAKEGTYNWAIHANDLKWAMDDATADSSVHTIHRLWVRHNAGP